MPQATPHPHPGRSSQAFLGEIEAHGIWIGDYNPPDWDDTADGLHRKTDSLFQLTPATVPIIGDLFLVFPVHVCLTRPGIVAPDRVPLVSIACRHPNHRITCLCDKLDGDGRLKFLSHPPPP